MSLPPHLFAPISMIYDPNTTLPVLVRNLNGKIGYYYYDNQWLKDTTLSTVGVKGDISAVWEPHRNHAAFFFVGMDGFLNYYYFQNGKRFYEVNAFKVAGMCTGPVCAVYENHRNHSAVFMRGQDGYLHYFYLDGGKFKHEVNAFKVAGTCKGDISAIYCSGVSQSTVYMKGGDDYVHVFWDDGGKILHDGNTYMSGGFCTGSIAAAYNLTTGSSVFFVGGDGYLKYFCYKKEEGYYHMEEDVFKEGGAVCGDITAANDPEGKPAIFFKVSDGVSFFALSNEGWFFNPFSYLGTIPQGKISAVFNPLTKSNSIYMAYLATDGYVHMIYSLDGIEYVVNKNTYN